MKKVLTLISIIFISACVKNLEGAKNLDEKNIAVKGYDVVSYFEESSAKKGSDAFSALHDDAIYHFSSKKNLDNFKENPEAYIPQYGGFCAYGMARNYKVDIDPTAWKIVDNKLYLNYTPNTHKIWLDNIEENIQEANANWSKQDF